jgi:hypothetical protein
MLERHKVNVVIVEENLGVGIGDGAPTRSVDYSGDQVEVKQ